MIRAHLAALLFGLIGFESTAQTREEEPPFQAGTPYLIAVPDEMGTSSRSPGIYIRDGRSWRLALEGEVLLESVTGGLSHVIEFPRVANDFQSLCILDGRLTFFSTRSRDEDPQSIFEIDQIRDPILGQKIPLPMIEDIEDVSIEGTDIKMGAEPHYVVLVSMKTKNSIHGSGLTFAVIFNKESFESGKIRPIRDPVLLDYEFSDHSELFGRMFFHDNYSALVSRNLLQMAVQERGNEADFVVEWKQSLRDLMERLSPSEFFRLALKSGDQLSDLQEFWRIYPYLPLISIPHDRIEVRHPLRVGLGSDGPPIYAYYDAARGVQWLAGKENVLDETSPYVISTSAPHPQLAFRRVASSARSGLGLVVLRDERVLFTYVQRSRQQSIEIEPIRPAATDLVDLSAAYSAEAKVLVVSWQFESGDAETVAYEISDLEGRSQIHRVQHLSPKFFPQEDLARRMIIAAGERLLFDIETPVGLSSEDFQRKFRKTAATVDVLTTFETGRLSYHFLEPLREVSLSDGVSFFEFERPPEGPNPTGVYFTKSDDSVDSALGYLPSLIRNEMNLAIDLKVKTGWNSLTEIQIVGFYLTDLPDAASKARLVLLLVDSEAKMIDSPIEIDLDSSFEDIRDIHLFPSVGMSASDGLKLALSISQSEGEAIETSIRYLILSEIRIKSNSGNVEQSRFEIHGTKALINIEGALTKEEFLSRIFVSPDAGIYFSQDPGRDLIDPNFRVIRLSDGQQILTRNAPKLRLRPAALGDGALSESQGRFYSNWLVRDWVESDPERRRARNAAEYQTDVFPEYPDLLNDLADIRTKARKVVLIVSPDLLRYAGQYPFAYRHRDAAHGGPWHKSSGRYQLYALPKIEEPISQREVLENIRHMISESRTHQKAPVLLESIDKIARVSTRQEKTQNETSDLILSRAIGNSVSLDGEDLERQPERLSQAPSILYFLATGGQRVDAADFVADSNSPISTLLIGTEESWEKLREAHPIENEMGVFDLFEVVKLSPPTSELRLEFARKNLLLHPGVRMSQFQVSLEGLVADFEKKSYSVEELEDKILTYLINRSEKLALDNGMPVFESFLKVLSELLFQMTTSERIRKRRVLDLRLVEQSLARVFPMPVNLDLLDDEDHLKILSRKDIIHLWQTHGYTGPIEFKQRLIQVLLAQLSTDQVRNLKSSAIIYGGTGTSKTTAIRTLISALEFEIFSMTGEPPQSTKLAFVLNMAQVLGQTSNSKENNSSERMLNFEQAKKAFESFLTAEGGERGLIFLDDFHLAPPEAREYFIQRIRALQDEKTFVDLEGRERPTRNLSVLIALNPKSNPEKLRQFAKNPHHPTDTELILASLSTPDLTLEESFLRRFGDLISLNRFPFASKGPALNAALLPSRQTHFNNHHQLVFVHPSVLSSIIKNTPEVDARTFLSSAASSLMGLSRGNETKLFLIRPRFSSERISNRSTTGSHAVSGGDEGSVITRFVQEHFQALPVGTNSAGQIEFSLYLMNNLRLKLFEVFLDAVRSDIDLMSQKAKNLQIVGALANALEDHLNLYQELSLEEIRFQPSEFGVTDEFSVQEFKRAYDAVVTRQRSRENYHSLPELHYGSSVDLDLFGGGDSENQPSEVSIVLGDKVAELEALLEGLAAFYLRLKDLQTRPSIEDWLQNQKEQTNLPKEVGQAVLASLKNFLDTFLSVRSREAGAVSDFNYYDLFRVFFIALDRSVSRLNWSRITGFSIKILDSITRDMSVAQSPLVQSFVFDAKDSILSSVDLSLILGMISILRADAPASSEERIKGFEGKCDRWINELGRSQ
ncbi:MAG: ATP-binding protein [Bradymonadales bacterium]|nr:MAG: ATP-binding protein [Bradymonadales bacterium]